MHDCPCAQRELLLVWKVADAATHDEEHGEFTCVHDVAAVSAGGCGIIEQQRDGADLARRARRAPTPRQELLADRSCDREDAAQKSTTVAGEEESAPP